MVVGVPLEYFQRHLFSTNDAIDKIKCNEKSVEVQGFIDVVERPKIVGKIKKYNLIKFVLNNGAGRRIQCLAWGDEVKRVSDVIELNMILHVDKARSKKIENAAYNTGDVPFELIMESYTLLEDVGRHQVENEDKSEAIEISWNQIPDMEGKKIEISGWIKSKFDEIKHKNGESSFGVGSITNSHQKLEVRIASLGNSKVLNLEKGQAVNVIGTVNFSSYLYLQVAVGSDIEKSNEENLNTMNMFNITEMPEKRSKAEK